MVSIPSIAKALTAPRSLEDVPPALELPDGYGFSGLLFGNDLQEVLVVSYASSPTLTDGRAIHKSRDAKRNVVLVVAIEGPNGVYLVGPNPDGNLAGPLPPDQATRILQAGLDEQTALAARRRLSHLLAAVDTGDDLAGVTNSGLFANHYLSTSARERSDWGERTEASRPMLGLRGSELVTELGYQTSGLGAGALLLSSSSGPVHAVAVLMTDLEGFDASTERFGSSPVQYGLAKAHQERVPWLIVLRGSQIRLYPVRPDTGVGRRSQAETYLELDLSVVDDRTAGFLSLVFAEGALDDDGTVQELLDGSIRYATDLGERLRERVYNHVVPSLAVAVARELERIGHGDDLDAAYRITLKVLFRLLFQAYAEDQGLLPYNRNDRYTRNSLTIQANDFVERPDRELDAESHAIWSDLRQVWDVIDTGNKDWNVPAYNGGLFGQDPVLHPDGHLIDQMRLDDHSTGTALRYLLTDDTSDGELGSVDFRSLSVREFGTIYEGLLESLLSRAETDLSLDKNKAYVPTDDPEKAVIRTGQIYFHNASGERKATGSYFTKPFAVEHLLERALDPTLTEHLEQVQALLTDDKPADAADKFFDFRVADLAMGSGHFLIAAIDRMEIQMAAFLTDHPIPAISQELDRLKAAARTALGDSADDHEIEPSALLRRQIARRCIYGIDINEIAVELARVAVWIHTFVPGLPMSSLDHTLVCSNSLTGIGTIDEALDALEPKRKKATPSLFRVEIENALEEAKDLLVDAANSLEADKKEVKQAADAMRKAAESAAPTRLLFDAALARRIGAVEELPLNTDEIRDLANGEHVQKQVSLLNAAHMPFLFPEVFLRAHGGFDVLIGNPPWEKAKVEEQSWWGLRFPGLHRSLKKKESIKRIEELKVERPDLVDQFNKEAVAARLMRQAISSGRYPGIGKGDIDLYQAFAWRNWNLCRRGGRFGLVLPRGALIGSGTIEWRKEILSQGTIEDLCFLTNTREWVFEGVHGRYTLTLAVVSKSESDEIRFGGPFYSHREFLDGRDHLTSMSKSELFSWNDSAAFPSIPTPRAINIVRKLAAHPTFAETESFEFRLTTDLHSRNDRTLFDFNSDGLDRFSVPVLTGRSLQMWDPDAGEIFAHSDPGDLLPFLLAKATSSRRRAGSAYHGLEINSAEDLPIQRARIGYKKITSPTNRRSAIQCLMPPRSSAIDAVHILMRTRGSEEDEAYMLGVMCSIPFDWYVRRWVELNLTFEIFRRMRVPEPEPDHPLRRRLATLSGRLSAHDERYADWAAAVSVPTGTLTNPIDRDNAIAEIDAVSALLYGLEWDDLVHIFETFHRGWDYTERLVAVQVHFDRWKDSA